MTRNIAPFAACIAFAFVVLTATSLNAAEPAATSPYRVIAYVMGRATVADRDAERLTHINYAFAQVNRDGEAFLRNERSAERLAQLVALREKHPHLKIILSIGGWGADNFSDAALTDESRRKFAASAVKLVDDHRLDGVDLDWEYPGQPGPGIKFRPEDKQNFTLLLAEFRNQLDAYAQNKNWPDDRRPILTIASAAGRYFDYTEMDKLHAHLDWINIMTYDYYTKGSETTGHHAGLHQSGEAQHYGAAAVEQHLAAGIPAGKLVLGAAFYGRGWSGVEPANNGVLQKYERYAGEYPYSRLKREFVDRGDFERHWDGAAKAPFLWNPVSHTFIAYDDPESLAAKAEYVKERGLGGMMFWEYSADADGELLGAIAAALRTPQ